MTPLWIAAQENKPECIAILAAAKASLEGAIEVGPISMAAHQGSEECVALLAYLGARLVEEVSETRVTGGGFWLRFKDQTGLIRNPKLWEWIVRKGGDEGTPESLRKRIRMLKKADVHDPRDRTS